MRLVRFRNAPVMPLQETARTGPSPSLLITTSTFFVFNPPRTVASPPVADARVEVEEMLTASLGHGERRSGLDLIRVKSAFEDETAGDVPMERLDVLLALRGSVVADEVLEGVGLIDPLTHARGPCRPLVATGRHSVSTCASSRRPPSSRAADSSDCHRRCRKHDSRGFARFELQHAAPERVSFQARNSVERTVVSQPSMIRRTAFLSRTRTLCTAFVQVAAPPSFQQGSARARTCRSGRNRAPARREPNTTGCAFGTCIRHAPVSPCRCPDIS